MTTCQLQPPNKTLLFAQLAGLEVLQLIRRLARRMGYRRPRPLAHLALQPPDTVPAQDSRALVERLSSAALANHCHRSFMFAVAIGRHRNLQFDAELLYIATMLHDLGLTESCAGPETFETRGANAARDFCERSGLDPERTDRVHEAIALHTSALSAFGRPQIALVQLGAAADVIGYHIEDVAPETIACAVRSFPRLGLKQELQQLLTREAKQNPDMFIASQMRLGFSRRIQRAPFSD